jgi:hypothetical protein
MNTASRRCWLLVLSSVAAAGLGLGGCENKPAPAPKPAQSSVVLPTADPAVSWYPIADVGALVRLSSGAAEAGVDPAAFLQGMGLVAEQRDGRWLLLLWNSPERSLVPEPGQWKLERVQFKPDDTARSVLWIDLDALGQERLRLLTAANLKRSLAVLVDDQVYSAPTVQSPIAGPVTVHNIATAGDAEAMRTKLEKQNTLSLRVAVNAGERSDEASLRAALKVKPSGR